MIEERGMIMYVTTSLEKSNRYMLRAFIKSRVSYSEVIWNAISAHKYILLSGICYVT